MAIYRVHKKKDFFGNSFCDFCKKPLKINDLIPLFSFIYFKGKSRCCNKKLDKTMPIVEVLTATCFLVIAYLFLNGYFNDYLKYVSVVFWLIISSILIFLFFYDLKYFELPVLPVVAGYVLWIVYKVVDYFLYFDNYKLQIINSQLGKYLIQSGYINNQVNYFKEDLLWTIGFAIFVFIFFLFLFLITKGRGMGFGDVYFSPLLALIVGYPASPIYLSASFIVGAVFGVCLILFKGKNMKTAVPFGPFLIIGLIIALTFKNLLYTF